VWWIVAGVVCWSGAVVAMLQAVTSTDARCLLSSTRGGSRPVAFRREEPKLVNRASMPSSVSLASSGSRYLDLRGGL